MVPAMQIREQICGIQALYTKVKEITMGLLADFSPDTLDRAVRERSLLLLKIADEENSLRRVAGPHFLTGASGGGDLASTIESMAILDAQVSEKISYSMSSIATSLADLSRSSRATSAYTIHSRRSLNA